MVRIFLSLCAHREVGDGEAGTAVSCETDGPGCQPSRGPPDKGLQHLLHILLRSHIFLFKKALSIIIAHSAIQVTCNAKFIINFCMLLNAMEILFDVHQSYIPLFFATF